MRKNSLKVPLGAQKDNFVWMPHRKIRVSGFYDGSAHGGGIRHADTNADFVMNQVGLSLEGKTGFYD